MADPAPSRSSFRRFNEEDAIGDVVSSLRADGAVEEILVVDDGSRDATGERAAPPARGRAASVQQGQRRRGQDRHSPRRRRVRPDPRRRRPASPVGCASGSWSDSANTIWWSAPAMRDAGHDRRARQPAAERLATHLTGRVIPDLTSGFRGARREHLREFLHLLPNGFSTPTTTTLAFIKAGYNVTFEPIARGRARAIEDQAGARWRQVLPDPPEGHHHLQPAARLRADQRRVAADGVVYGLVNFAMYGRIPNGAVILILFAVIVFLVGLISEQISSLRFDGRRGRSADAMRPSSWSRPTTNATTCADSSPRCWRIDG